MRRGMQENLQTKNSKRKWGRDWIPLLIQRVRIHILCVHSLARTDHSNSVSSRISKYYNTWQGNLRTVDYKLCIHIWFGVKVK